MTQTTSWPDRDAFAGLMEHAPSYLQDAELCRAEFRRKRNGQGLATWNGARAIVFRADVPGGASYAVRFPLSEDVGAGLRYDMLARHLIENPVPVLVRTHWQAGGLRIADGSFPVIKMQWVDGSPLDAFIDDAIGDPDESTVFGRLADSWLGGCRAMSAARVSHGDIHAGNALVVRSPTGVVELRLVDYDNVGLPQLHAPVREDGHPAFRHPARQAHPVGPARDALPNALTYVSLRALAVDSSLWMRHHSKDDTLLFGSEDLADLQRPVWLELDATGDPSVRVLAARIREWLAGPPGMYHDLDQLLQTQPKSSRFTPNVWPVGSVATSGGGTPPMPDPAGGSAGARGGRQEFVVNRWPVVGEPWSGVSGGAGAASPAAGGSSTGSAPATGGTAPAKPSSAMLIAAGVFLVLVFLVVMVIAAA